MENARPLTKDLLFITVDDASRITQQMVGGELCAVRHTSRARLRRKYPSNDSAEVEHDDDFVVEPGDLLEVISEQDAATAAARKEAAVQAPKEGAASVVRVAPRQNGHLIPATAESPAKLDGLCAIALAS